LRLATRLSVWPLLTLPACMENRAPVDPAATVTELGTLRKLAFVACKAMFKPPAGAAADRVILQVSDVCAVSTVELHVNPVRGTPVGCGGTSVSAKLSEVPFKLVASTAVLFALTVDAFAVKPAEFAPDGIRMDDGIVTLEPEARPVVTVSPPAGAEADSMTVHAEEPGVVTVAGEQVSPVSVYGDAMFTRPPVAATLTGVPLSVTPVLLSTWIGKDVPAAAGDAVRVAVATTPLPSVMLFRPNSMQVYDPEPPLQETDFPAATAAGPATTMTELKVAAG